MSSKSKTKLLVSSVTLNNYRAYQGNWPIELSSNPKKNITIIAGGMGAGKTTLFDAIHWCLYGEERSKTEQEFEEAIVNGNVLQNLRVGGKDTTSVEIIFNDDEGVRYKVKRSVVISKQSDNGEWQYSKTIFGKAPKGMRFEPSLEFQYLNPRSRKVDWEIYKGESAQDKIENIFPRILSSYFLFDAELLNDFFLSKSDDLVRNGIEKISGIPLLEDAIDHLKKTSQQINKDIADKDVNTKPILDELQEYERNVNDAQDKIKKIDERLNDIKVLKKGLTEYLRQHDDQEIKSTQEMIDTLDGQLNSLSKDINTASEHVRTFVLESVPNALLYDTIVKAEKIFQKNEDEGKIPPAVSKLALQNILSKKPSHCFCGTLLKDGSKEKKMIKDLMERVIDNNLTQHITTGRGLLSSIISRTGSESLSGQLTQLRSRRGSLNKDYDAVKTKKDSHQKKLDNHNLEEVQEKSRKKYELEQEEIKLIGDRQVEQDRLTTNSASLKKTTEELDKKTSKANKYNEEKNKAKLCKTIASILDQCKRELVDDLRQIAADRTTNIFLSIVSRRDDFSRVKIQENYKTIACDKNENSKKLSAGQSCCLALSYIAAIREIANRDYFMIIDSPLHNLSQQARVEVAQSLPGYLPGTQITLLVQDQEYTGSTPMKISGKRIPSVRDTLMPSKRVWREYLLESEKEKKSSISTTKVVVHNDSGGS